MGKRYAGEWPLLAVQRPPGLEWRNYIWHRDRRWVVGRPTSTAQSVESIKIHVAAALSQSAPVLKACLPVVRAHAAAFKFPVDSSANAGLFALRTNLRAFGKFLTIYPTDQHSIGCLVGDLHAATRDLGRGPVIVGEERHCENCLIFARPNAELVASHILPAPEIAELPKAFASSATEIVVTLRQSVKGSTHLVSRNGSLRIVKFARRFALQRFPNDRDSTYFLAREQQALALVAAGADDTEFCETDAGSYLSMPYWQGTTLLRTLREAKTSLPDYAAELAAVVRLMDKAGVTHGDISLTNALISQEGGVRLIDFGLARFRGEPGQEWYGAAPGFEDCDDSQAVAVVRETLKVRIAPALQSRQMIKDDHQVRWCNIETAVTKFALDVRTCLEALAAIQTERASPSFDDWYLRLAILEFRILRRSRQVGGTSSWAQTEASRVIGGIGFAAVPDVSDELATYAYCVCAMTLMPSASDRFDELRQVLVARLDQPISEPAEVVWLHFLVTLIKGAAADSNLVESSLIPRFLTVPPRAMASALRRLSTNELSCLALHASRLHGEYAGRWRTILHAALQEAADRNDGMSIWELFLRSTAVGRLEGEDVVRTERLDQLCKYGYIDQIGGAGGTAEFLQILLASGHDVQSASTLLRRLTSSADWTAGYPVWPVRSGAALVPGGSTFAIFEALALDESGAIWG